MSSAQDNANPFSDDANWAENADNAPLLDESRPVRPSTPRRTPSSRSSKSPNSGSRSGIVFGSPRRQRRLSNPFSDLQAGQQESPEGLAPPLRSFMYPRRVPDETGYAQLSNVHATPGNPIDEVDEKHDLDTPPYRDEEEDTGVEKSEKQYLRAAPATTLRRFLSRFRKQPWTAPEVAENRSIFSRFWKLILLVLIAVIMVSTVFVLSVLNTKTLSVHWKGTLSDSTGALDITGFNFTRHIELGFTNPNLFPTTLSGVEVYAAYDTTHFFGMTENDHVNLDIPGWNSRNLTLPVAMDFAYISNQDPDNYILQKMVTECGTSGNINFDLIVQAKVKALRLISYTAKFPRIATSMSCDNNMAVLVQAMYVKASSSA